MLPATTRLFDQISETSAMFWSPKRAAAPMLPPSADDTCRASCPSLHLCRLERLRWLEPRVGLSASLPRHFSQKVLGVIPCDVRSTSGHHLAKSNPDKWPVAATLAQNTCSRSRTSFEMVFQSGLYLPLKTLFQYIEKVITSERIAQWRRHGYPNAFLRFLTT